MSGCSHRQIRLTGRRGEGPEAQIKVEEKAFIQVKDIYVSNVFLTIKRLAKANRREMLRRGKRHEAWSKRIAANFCLAVFPFSFSLSFRSRTKFHMSPSILQVYHVYFHLLPLHFQNLATPGVQRK